MEGRITNRSLLQRASNFLGLEGVKQFPAHLDLSDIKVTYDISRISIPAITDGQEAGVSVAGQPSFDRNIAASALQGAVNGPFVATDNLETWVLASSLELVFDVAGAAAFNSKEVNIKLKYNLFSGSTAVEVYDIRFRVDTAIRRYFFTAAGGGYFFPNTTSNPMELGGGFKGWVPPGAYLSWFGNSIDGTNFPAVTQVNVKRITAQLPLGQSLNRWI
jgi:hypothetical protein